MVQWVTGMLKSESGLEEQCQSENTDDSSRRTGFPGKLGRKCNIHLESTINCTEAIMLLYPGMQLYVPLGIRRKMASRVSFFSSSYF